MESGYILKLIASYSSDHKRLAYLYKDMQTFYIFEKKLAYLYVCASFFVLVCHVLVLLTSEAMERYGQSGGTAMDL